MPIDYIMNGIITKMRYSSVVERVVGCSIHPIATKIKINE